MNPLDEYLMEKEAAGGFGAAVSQASKAAKGIAGSETAKGIAVAVGSTALLAGLAPAAQKIWGAMTRQSDFKEMMGTNPDLHDIRQENPQFFNQAYNSLRRINPTFGGDPIIAGAYMRKMMANKDAAGLTLAQSVKTPDAGIPRSPVNFELGFSPPRGGGGFAQGMAGKGKFAR